MSKRVAGISCLVFTAFLCTPRATQALETVTNLSQFATAFDVSGLRYPQVLAWEGAMFEAADLWWADFS